MAEKELKATEKTVLKHSRDGVVEKNLADSSEKRVSKHTEEAVLKTEAPSDMRFDKLQVAGIAAPEPTKRRLSNLQFGRNNPENQWEEQRTEAKNEMSGQAGYSNENSVLTFTAEEYKEAARWAKPVKGNDFSFKGKRSEVQSTEQTSPSRKPRPPEKKSLEAELFSEEKSVTVFSVGDDTPKLTFKEQQFTRNTSDETYTLSEKSVIVSENELRSAVPSEEYRTSDKTVSISADEFLKCGEDYNFKDNALKEERSKDDLSLEKEVKKSKLKENKERNTLKEHSSAADKLFDDSGDTMLYFECEGSQAPDKECQKLEKKLEKAQKRLSRLEEKNDKKRSRLVKKDEKRVYKLEKRVAKAEDKLPHHRVFHVRKEFNPEKQKMQRKLRLEKEAKPSKSGGIVTKGIKGTQNAVKTTISGAIHSEISKYEQDDTTLKAAHGTEKLAESALRFTKDSIKAHHQRLKEKPYQKVSKLKFQRETTAQKLNEHKALSENKKLRKDENSKRKKIKKSQQKLRRKNATKKSAKKTASSAGKKTARAGEKVAESIVKVVANNKVVIIIIVIFLALFAVVGIFGSAALSSVSETGGMIIGSTYTSDEEDIYAANDYMNSLESALAERLNNIPNEYVGWNEYRWNFDAIGHDPYALTSYLTAMELAFEFDDITKARIDDLFNALYTLNIQSIHEVRSYQYTEIDENGNEVLVTVYYDYYILEATLTANDWESVVKPQLEFAGVYDLYLLLQENRGNKPDLF